MTKTMKKIGVILLVLVTMFAIAVPAFAVVAKEDAKSAALTAADVAFIKNDVPKDARDAATITKCVLKDNVYSITVRSGYTYSYTCTVSSVDIIVGELPKVENGAYSTTSEIEGFIMTMIDKIVDFLSNLF